MCRVWANPRLFRWGLGQVLGKGGPCPKQRLHWPLLHSSPRFLGREEDSDGVQVLCFLLELLGKMLEALKEDPLAEGWTGAWRGGGSTIGRPNQASRQTDEGNNIITPRTPWGRYSKYLIK